MYDNQQAAIRGVGMGEARVPRIFSKDRNSKVPPFVMKSALFEQANVAGNTTIEGALFVCKFRCFKNKLVKNIHCTLQFGMV